MKKLLLISILFLSACVRPTVQHPGALNSFDNSAYDTLIVEQAAINQAKTLVKDFPAIKAPLNVAVQEYDTTMAAYKVYHLALAAGKNPDVTLIASSIQDLVVKVAAILKVVTK